MTEESLPPRFKEKIKQKNTVLTHVQLIIDVKNGAATIKPLNVEADGFLFQGTGGVAFDQQFSFDGSFIIPQDLAFNMAKVVPELGGCPRMPFSFRPALLGSRKSSTYRRTPAVFSCLAPWPERKVLFSDNFLGYKKEF